MEADPVNPTNTSVNYRPSSVASHPCHWMHVTHFEYFCTRCKKAIGNPLDDICQSVMSHHYKKCDPGLKNSSALAAALSNVRRTKYGQALVSSNLYKSGLLSGISVIRHACSCGANFKRKDGLNDHLRTKGAVDNRCSPKGATKYRETTFGNYILSDDVDSVLASIERAEQEMVEDGYGISGINRDKLALALSDSFSPRPDRSKWVSEVLEEYEDVKPSEYRSYNNVLHFLVEDGPNKKASFREKMTDMVNKTTIFEGKGNATSTDPVLVVLVKATDLWIDNQARLDTEMMDPSARVLVNVVGAKGGRFGDEDRVKEHDAFVANKSLDKSKRMAARALCFLFEYNRSAISGEMSLVSTFIGKSNSDVDGAAARAHMAGLPYLVLLKLYDEKITSYHDGSFLQMFLATICFQHKKGELKTVTPYQSGTLGAAFLHVSKLALCSQIVDGGNIEAMKEHTKNVLDGILMSQVCGFISRQRSMDGNRVTPSRARCLENGDQMIDGITFKLIILRRLIPIVAAKSLSCYEKVIFGNQYLALFQRDALILSGSGNSVTSFRMWRGASRPEYKSQSIFVNEGIDLRSACLTLSALVTTSLVTFGGGTVRKTEATAAQCIEEKQMFWSNNRFLYNAKTEKVFCHVQKTGNSIVEHSLPKTIGPHVLLYFAVVLPKGSSGIREFRSLGPKS